MPRIERAEHSEHYEELRRVASAHNEKGDCAVKALSLLTDLPYDQVLQALNNAGRKPRGGTPFFVIDRALADLGFKLEKLEGWTARMIATYPGVHKNLNNVTTHHPRRFKKAWAEVEPLLLDCAHHVAAFKDGLVHDWTINKSMRVRNVYRVARLAEEATEAAGMSAAVVDEVVNAVGLSWLMSAEEQGYADALRGHTVCPDERIRKDWERGYDRAVEAGLAEFPRFGTRGAR